MIKLAKKNASGIHDIFYPKYNSKLELFKVLLKDYFIKMKKLMYLI